MSAALSYSVHTPSMPPHLPVSQSDFAFRKISTIRQRIAGRQCSVVYSHQRAVQDALHEIFVMTDLYSVRCHEGVGWMRSETYQVYHFLLRYDLVTAKDRSISILSRPMADECTNSECAVAIDPTPRRNFVLFTVQAPRSVP